MEQGHSFVPGHKLRGEQVLAHGPNQLPLSFWKKAGAVPLLLQRGNTTMGNYALRGTLVFTLSPLGGESEQQREKKQQQAIDIYFLV